MDLADRSTRNRYDIIFSIVVKIYHICVVRWMFKYIQIPLVFFVENISRNIVYLKFSGKINPHSQMSIWVWKEKIISCFYKK